MKSILSVHLIKVYRLVLTLLISTSAYAKAKTTATTHQNINIKLVQLKSNLERHQNLNSYYESHVLLDLNKDAKKYLRGKFRKALTQKTPKLQVIGNSLHIVGKTTNVLTVNSLQPLNVSYNFKPLPVPKKIKDLNSVRQLLHHFATLPVVRRQQKPKSFAEYIIELAIGRAAWAYNEEPNYYDIAAPYGLIVDFLGKTFHRETFIPMANHTERNSYLENLEDNLTNTKILKCSAKETVTRAKVDLEGDHIRVQNELEISYRVTDKGTYEIEYKNPANGKTFKVVRLLQAGIGHYQDINGQLVSVESHDLGSEAAYFCNGHPCSADFPAGIGRDNYFTRFAAENLFPALSEDQAKELAQKLKQENEVASSNSHRFDADSDKATEQERRGNELQDNYLSARNSYQELRASLRRLPGTDKYLTWNGISVEIQAALNEKVKPPVMGETNMNTEAVYEQYSHDTLKLVSAALNNSREQFIEQHLAMASSGMMLSTAKRKQNIHLELGVLYDELRSLANKIYEKLNKDGKIGPKVNLQHALNGSDKWVHAPSGTLFDLNDRSAYDEWGRQITAANTMRREFDDQSTDQAILANRLAVKAKCADEVKSASCDRNLHVYGHVDTGIIASACHDDESRQFIVKGMSKAKAASSTKVEAKATQ